MKDNSGRYGEDFSKAPTQKPGESAQAYGMRLKEWQRKRSMSGSAAKKPTPQKKKEPAGGWVDKLLRGLDGKS